MTVFSSWDAIGAVIVAVLMLVVPGFIVISALRFRLLPHLALSAPLSFALIGCVGVVDGLLHVTFHWWHIFVVAVVIGGVLYWALHLRRGRRFAFSWKRPLWQTILPAFAWILSSAAFSLILFHQLASFDLFSQSYDNLFHLNATKSILESGNASSLQLRTLINTGRTFSTYPAGWHTAAAMVCQVTGVSIAVAFNALSIAVVTVAWLPGVAWLTSLLVPARHRTLGICTSLLLGTVFGFFPYALLVWGVLYPTFLAYALFPSGLALAALLGSACCPRLAPDLVGQRQTENDVTAAPVHSAMQRRLPLLVLTAAWWLGAFFTHPRSLVSMVLLIAPLGVWISCRAIAGSWRARGRRRRRMLWWLGGCIVVSVVFVIGAFVVAFRMFHVATRPVSDHLNGPQAQSIQTVWQGLWQVVSQNALVGLGTDTTGPLLLLAIVTLAGLVYAACRPDLRWMVASYAAIATLFALAAGSDSDLTKILTGLWYKDRYRLSALLPIIGVPLVTVVLLRLSALTRWRTVVAAAAAIIVSLTSWIGLWTPFGQAAANEYRLETTKTTDFVDTAQISFMQRVTEYVPSDQLLLGDPWDGSGLSWIYADRRPVFPHLNGQWDPDRLLIAEHLDQINDDPAVCGALRRLNVHFVLTSPGQLDGGDPSGNKFSAIHAAVDAGLFTPVVSDGTSTLYRIDQCR